MLKYTCVSFSQDFMLFVLLSVLVCLCLYVMQSAAGSFYPKWHVSVLHSLQKKRAAWNSAWSAPHWGASRLGTFGGPQWPMSTSWTWPRKTSLTFWGSRYELVLSVSHMHANMFVFILFWKGCGKCLRPYWWNGCPFSAKCFLQIW